MLIAALILIKFGKAQAINITENCTNKQKAFNLLWKRLVTVRKLTFEFSSISRRIAFPNAEVCSVLNWPLSISLDEKVLALILSYAGIYLE